MTRTARALAVLAALCSPLAAAQDDRAAAFAEVQAEVAAAQAASRAGDLGGAARALEAAVAIFSGRVADPHASLAELYRQLGRLRRADGRLAAAREAFAAAHAQALALPPEGEAPAAAVIALAEAHLDLGEAAAARALLDGAEPPADPRLRRAHLAALGNAALVAADHPAAVSALTEALALAEAEPGAGAAFGLATLLAKAQLAARAFAAAERTLARAEGAVSDDPHRGAAERAELAILAARIEIAEGAYAAAEARLSDSAAELATAGLGESLAMASARYNLGEIALMQGDFARAEEETLAALELYAAATRWRHRIIGQIYLRLALIYQEVGDTAQALDFYARGAEILEVTVGPGHPSTLLLLNESTEALTKIGDLDAALARNRGVQAGFEALGAGFGHQQGLATAREGLIRLELGDDAGAERAFEAALALMQGPGKMGETDMPRSLLGLAEIALRAGDTAKARAHAERARQILARTESDTPARLSESRRILAEIAAAEGRPDTAQALAEANLDTAFRNIRALSRSLSYASEFRLDQVRTQLHQYLALSHGAAPAAELFRAVQVLSLTETAKASNGIAETAAADPALTALIVERRRAVAQHKSVASQYRQSLIHDQSAAPGFMGELDALEAEIRRLDAAIDAAAPEGAGLAALAPAPLAEIRAALGPGEALWLQASFEAETFLFLLTPKATRIARLPLGAAEIARDVAAVRASLEPTSDGGVRPFAYAPAARLYERLFALFGAEIGAASRLYLVPDGAMQALSPHVLVVEEGPGEGREKALASRFLGLEVAMAVLPTPGALRDGVAVAGPKRRVPFFGVGDPDLEGRPGDLRGVLPREAVNLVRRTVNPALLRTLFPPLPETALEVSIFSEFYGEAESRTLLRSEATEARIRSADLSSVSVLLFATHAVVSGEFDGAFEPGLILTPPEGPEEGDDGFLAASEIAELRVGADIVILSACNTGGTAGRPGAEGLSGLARAFFHAGAQALLVSHWPVASDPSVFLTTGMERRHLAEPGIGRPEALRRTMARLAGLDVAQSVWHPSIWGPFVIVGLG